jgi:PAS domain S-box-containing protein
MSENYQHPNQQSHSIAALQKESERLQLLLNVTHILPWEADFPRATFSYVGEKATDVLGYPTAEWYESDFLTAHLHPDDCGPALARWFDYSNPHDNYESECRMIAKNGEVVWLHNLATVVRENGRPKAIRGFSIDITRSKQNENELRDLSGRLINAQEEERRRVARELHDDLNQRMAMLTVELEQLDEINKPTNLGQRLRSVQTHAKEISADIHRLSYKLHPSKLDYLGLAPAVRSLCEEFRLVKSLNVEFHETDFPDDLSKDVVLCLFRITQEALRNCVKHSGAGSARVTLECIDDEIRLSIADDGCGFDMESEAMRKGLGFTSMRERLRIVGGKMDVRSKPMQGTIIEVSVPLVRELEAASI